MVTPFGNAISEITTVSTTISTTSSRSKFSKGRKGKLTTKHDNPRKLLPAKYLSLREAMGGEDNVLKTVAIFNNLNTESEDRADGLIYQMKEAYKLSDRLIKELFSIGSGRLSRVKQNKDKKKAGGVNGLQVLKIIFYVSFGR